MAIDQRKPQVETGAGGCECPRRVLPFQNYALAVAVIAAVTGAAWWLNARTGLPFGRWTVMVAPGARLTGFPLWQPGLAVLALLSARSTARLLLRHSQRSRNHGLRLLLLAPALATLSHVAVDLLATERLGWWQWASGPRWSGLAPVPAAATWVVLTAAMALATPALLDKRPGRRQPPRRAWLVWFLTTLPAVACSAGGGRDAAVAVLAAPTLTVGMMAFYRSRETGTDCAPPAVGE